jgi:orotate phosphoribosyltransferase
MDRKLAQAIVDLEIPSFGGSEKNKTDSLSCLFRPRRLLSSPEMLDHIGGRIADTLLTRAASQTIVGLATSGIAWASLAAARAKVPMMYVRKQAEPDVSNDMVEGIFPTNRRVVLVDDLLFTGQSKRAALRMLQAHGLIVTDIIVIIDRQLQRKSDGLSLQDEFGLELHALIRMTDIVDFMIERDAITESQLDALIVDYRAHERWFPPDFMLRDRSRRAS